MCLAAHTTPPFSTFQGSTRHPTVYTQGLWASSAYILPVLPLLQIQIRRHYCPLSPFWLMPKASSTTLLLVTYMGCECYTQTWVCQIHSKALSACINVSRPYICSLTQSLISWPSHMIHWY